MGDNRFAAKLDRSIGCIHLDVVLHVRFVANGNFVLAPVENGKGGDINFVAKVDFSYHPRCGIYERCSVRFGAE